MVPSMPGERWPAGALRVGVISDTHGQLRREAVAALEGCALVLHAGDVGRPEVLAGLRQVASRLVVVRGNVDGPWARDLPDRAEVDVAGRRVLLLHDLKQLEPAGASAFDVVVAGHSHQPRIERRDGILYVNPGSAGPRRFRLPVAVARLGFTDEAVSAEIVVLDV